ncbi:MAG: hypothetical protein H7641_13465 [Candidatus Heimdallarchaeota archaeon]|nr:hypothetical protein [Candidatus Heimdallarchaeota archaeon]MCK4878569.1 hypothetical protein [Candidatus Heimdallarchaeota archaeon]
MAYINSFEEDDFDKDIPDVKVRRSSIRDVLKVCPVCFSPAKIENANIFMVIFACTKEGCGWSGPVAIEVNQDDYNDFFEKQKESKQN